MTDAPAIEPMTAKLVGAAELLKILFDEDSRPSTKWLYHQYKAKKISHIVMGRRVFFEPETVRREINQRHTIRSGR